MNHEEERNQQRSLADFGARALTASSLEEVLQQACNFAAAGLGTEFVKIVERCDDERLLLRAWTGFEPREDEHLMEPGRGSSVGLAVEQGRSIVSGDAFADDRFDRAGLMKRYRIRSIINIPIPRLEGEREPWGVLEADSPEVNAFDADQTDFLTIFATLVGAAVAKQVITDQLVHARAQAAQLLKELQHRIKNNFATVIGLVSMHARQAEHEDTRTHLKAISGRIDTLRLVHEQLYERSGDEYVALGEYLDALLANLLEFNEAAAKKVTLDTDFCEASMDADSAIPIGLIANEFVTNSLKYAFDESGGTLTVRLTCDDDYYNLMLRDDGRGLPDEATAGGTGMRIIEGLVNQIGARSRWESAGGTALIVDIPRP